MPSPEKIAAGSKPLALNVCGLLFFYDCAAELNFCKWRSLHARQIALQWSLQNGLRGKP